MTQIARKLGVSLRELVADALDRTDAEIDTQTGHHHRHR
ncbi:MAG: hypothetical protein AVDCRST_MAG68-5101 [uncultured Gemmatimonadetes bacterium]|uniref:Uncharacterized protein n=1 Tax=uncultured Gemmatimonadota bacterium TaxID=203437 RepID=A0A6J4MP54_9BACT|nr:MAG: hypothetical protein AVDCRST_MAG68-5101 [uncultured Gemmatimonadota bacterium]